MWISYSPGSTGALPRGSILRGASKQKHLFTIVVGYGTCKDSGFLLKAMRNGISFYSSNIYDIKELMHVLNKVYEQYRRQQMELRLRVEEEKRHTEKYYNSGLLHEWTADFCRNATKHNEASHRPVHRLSLRSDG